jgi:hypothetical protein
MSTYHEDPQPPRKEKLPAAKLPRVPAPDLNQPVPLPVLARPQADRAPLTDPTGDASLAAALAQPVPVRTTPAPPLRLNLPDPFENHQVARVRTPPPEEPQPVAPAPKKPVP